jgi:hypothetical protein
MIALMDLLLRHLLMDLAMKDSIRKDRDMAKEFKLKQMVRE